MQVSKSKKESSLFFFNLPTQSCLLSARRYPREQEQLYPCAEKSQRCSHFRFSIAQPSTPGERVETIGLFYSHHLLRRFETWFLLQRVKVVIVISLFIYRYISGFLDKQQRQQEQLSVELALSNTIALCKYMLSEIQI